MPRSTVSRQIAGAAHCSSAHDVGTGAPASSSSPLDTRRGPPFCGVPHAISMLNVQAATVIRAIRAAFQRNTFRSGWRTRLQAGAETSTKGLLMTFSSCATRDSGTAADCAETSNQTSPFVARVRAGNALRKRRRRTEKAAPTHAAHASMRRRHERQELHRDCAAHASARASTLPHAWGASQAPSGDQVAQRWP